MTTKPILRIRIITALRKLVEVLSFSDFFIETLQAATDVKNKEFCVMHTYLERFSVKRMLISCFLMKQFYSTASAAEQLKQLLTG